MDESAEGPTALGEGRRRQSFSSALKFRVHSAINGRSSTASDLGKPTPLEAMRSRIWDLAGPALAENFFATMTQMLSMIMVGRVGPIAVAAVGLTNQPFMLGLALSFALNVGTTAVIARSIGAKDYATADETAKQSFLVNGVLAVIFSIAGYYYAEPILLFMGAGPDVLPSGLVYFRIISLTFGFSSLSMGIAAMLRGAGDTRTPMRVNMIANICVVLVGYPLIYGILGFGGLGVAGAAIASGVARFVGMALGLWALVRGNVPVHIRFATGCRPDWQLLTRVSRVGIPTAMEQFVMRTGQILFIRVVASLGTEVFAAHQIALNVLSLSFMPGMAFAVAATTLVGQNLGAGRTDEAVAVGWEVRRLGMWLAWTVSAVFIFLGPWIMRLYTTDPTVIAQGAIALKIIGLIQPPQISQFILAGGLRGAGDTRWPLYATMVGMWGSRVLLSHIFVTIMGWGLVGAWASMALDQLARSYVIAYRYRDSEKWVRLKV